MFNITSDSWKAIQRKLIKDRQDILEQLATPANEADTALLRGKIAMIDEILLTYPRDLRKPADEPE
ncbi:hypothetical protein [Shewanella sp. T24-MNA-CIBAN-0130]|uniref:hypothetical protein n=1 Tax=Shewanella sp. T24-MNA-CIBAN-0130 TaxID=3140470 RepID=UPI003327AC3D